ncbi:MAG TPA: glycerophosphodiester phosphodiesterase [Jatrophihabitans sp.]|nr:glycerophosphodiester phosphodiesterase [Jatrophihabitans sp.]
MSKRRVLLIAAVIVTVVVAAGVLAWPWVRIYTGAAPPDQFYRELSPPPATAGRDVLGVAHNAGNNAATTSRALDYGADVIEIDVITVHGKLAAGRAHHWRWLAERVFRGQSLADAWKHAAPAQIIKLDLQENDRGLLDALIDFLRPKDRPVLVSTRDADAIEYLRPRLGPAVRLLFSVPFPDAVTRVRTDHALLAAIGGISVFHGLVSADLVTWAHQRGLVVLAWTVSDGDQLNDLLRDDVDGVTTPNLAILRALSG